jgi:hypothetical protein
MNELALANRRLAQVEGLVRDSASSRSPRRVHDLGLDEFFAWVCHEPRPGFTAATVNAWRSASTSASPPVRQLAVEAADNGASTGTGRRHHAREGAKSKGMRRTVEPRAALTLVSLSCGKEVGCFEIDTGPEVRPRSFSLDEVGRDLNTLQNHVQDFLRRRLRLWLFASQPQL